MKKKKNCVLATSLVHRFSAVIIIVACFGGNIAHASGPILVDSSFYGGAGNQYGFGIIADANNLYLCGSDIQNSQAMFLKYSLPSGSSPIWSEVWPGGVGTGGEFFFGLAEVGEGVYLAGNSYSQTTDSLGSKENKAVLMKASKDGFTGADVGGSDWFEAPHFFSNEDYERFQSIISVVEGSSTYLYVAGSGKYTSWRTFLTKYDLNGTLIWFRVLDNSYNRPSLTNVNNSIYAAHSEYVWSYDPNGVLASTFQEAGANLSAICNDGEFIYAAGFIADGPNGGDDVLVLKYDLAGTLVNTVKWGGSGDESAHGIVEKDGTLYLTGRTNSFGSGGYDAFLLAIDSDSGDVKSSDYYGGANDEFGRAMTLSGSDIYIVGDSKSFAVNGNSIDEFEVMLLRYNLPVCHYKLPGDLNGDCKDDFKDLELLSRFWLIDCMSEPVSPECIPLDIDGDGFDVSAD